MGKAYIQLKRKSNAAEPLMQSRHQALTTREGMLEVKY